MLSFIVAVISLLVSMAAIATVVYAAILGKIALVYIGFAVCLVAVAVMDEVARNM